ncbi:MAG TPA: hypothetical protein VHZ53_02920, partial [Steroidobacteraceae bacterium]|nr:hypothetical protein [Steroidobacteraceae bacterium]
LDRKAACPADLVIEPELAEQFHGAGVDSTGSRMPQPALPPVDEMDVNTSTAQLDRQQRAGGTGTDDDHFVL